MTQTPPAYARPLAQLPLREYGLVHCPAIPYWVDKAGDPDTEHIGATLAGLQVRGAEGIPAYSGLGTKYTIDSQTHGAYEFLYGSPLATDATGLSLDQADDFALPWTTYGDVREDLQSLLGPFAQTLQTTAAANKAFWPTISTFGLPYYLLILEKVVTQQQADDFAAKFGKVWTTEKLDNVRKAGRLYVIDMSILETLEPFTARDGTVRFTPGTITLLVQDPNTKDLTPAAILLSTTDGKPPRVYGKKDQAWLYALQAAKTSITVWGIWLGHVYHLHIVTAAMQMTMYNHLPPDHRLLPLLEPQSQFLIDFDYVLATALFGKISPPTPISGPPALLKLLDTFAKKYAFLGDDPKAQLTSRGLDKADFSKDAEWDRYPLVGWLLEIWNITHEYVKAVVDVVYTNNGEVKGDTDLKAWMDACGDPLQSNLKSFPVVKTRDELTYVLTSLLYRVNVHGGGTLTPSVFPGLGFVANFPPCLQSAVIPEPGTSVNPAELLPFLPNTGTCGGMTTFFYTFVFSQPYVPLIPTTGINTDPFFPPSLNQCNTALFKFRTDIEGFVDTYVKDWNEAVARFSGKPAGPVPLYATNLYGQWAQNIEL
jgi:Lipoxygenase